MAYFKNNSKSLIFITFLLFGLLAGQGLHAQAYKARIMQYNLLAYPGNDSVIRSPHFRTIMRAAQPDILVTEEMESQTGVNSFLANIMNHDTANKYAAATFNDGYDTDNALFYNKKKFSFLNNTSLKTALRDINRFKMIHTATNDTFYIYVCHLKASAGADNETKRGAEVQVLRTNTDALPKGTSFILCGDFNIYGADEVAYKNLVAVNTSAEGEFYDPLSMTGIFNNKAYAIYHTQSPRVRSFGGGSNGGMDDRFDMILYSKAVKDTSLIALLPGTYKAYGNDGNHYNDSINHQPNTAVSVAVANALEYASDHIPVIADFKFKSRTKQSSSIASQPIALINDINVYPNPMTGDGLNIYLNATSNCDLNWKLTDMSGRTIYASPATKITAGSHLITETINLAAGTYILNIHAGDNTYYSKIVRTRSN